MKVIAVFIVLVSFLPIANAQQKKGKELNLEQLENLKNLDNALIQIDQAEASIKMLAKNREYECMKAIGSSKFCRCINQKLPLAVSFQQYVSVAISTKEEINYERLSAQGRQLVNLTMESRENCVGEY